MKHAALRFSGAGLWAMAAAVLLGACSGPPIPHGSMAQLFPNGPQPVEKSYTVDGHHIHYFEVDGAPTARILFIHGTPGDWHSWAGFMADPRLQARATMIAVDRAGFGDSDPGQVVPGMEQQSRLLEPLLRGSGAPTLVVGHSLGGPIAGRMAMDFPDEVRAALLIAPSIDPATEQPRWYNRLMEMRLVQWIAPEEFMWSNREIMPLDADLRAMTPGWKHLAMPITMIQGEKDKLVDPKTADFAEQALPQGAKVMRVPDEGHFVLWEKPQLVVDALLDLLDRTASDTNKPG